MMGLHMGEGKFVKDPTTGWLSYVGLPIFVLEKICTFLLRRIVRFLPLAVIDVRADKSAWGGQILVSEETHEQVIPRRSAMITQFLRNFIF